MQNNPSTTKARGGARSLLRKALAMREISVLLFIIGISIVLSFLSPYFLQASNLQSLLTGLSANGIVVIGMTIALAMGGLDLSVGSVMGLSSMVAALIIRGTGNTLAAVVAGLLVGVLCGLVNGLFIGIIKLNPFITTLAMMQICKGVTLMSTSGSAVSISDAAPNLRFLGQGTLGGVPVIILVFVLVAALGEFLMRGTQPFRKVFLIGSNEKAAKLSGINVTKVKFGVYVLCATLAAFAGIVSLGRFAASTPTTGSGVEMTAISAAVIGGASLNGGVGTVFGAFLGILLLNIVNNGLILLNVSVYGQELVSGLILLLAVTIDQISNRKKA